MAIQIKRQQRGQTSGTRRSVSRERLYKMDGGDMRLAYKVDGLIFDLSLSIY